MFDITEYKITLVSDYSPSEQFLCGGSSENSCGTEEFEVAYDQLEDAQEGYSNGDFIKVRVYSVNNRNLESFSQVDDSDTIRFVKQPSKI